MSPPPQPKRDKRSSNPEVYEPDPDYDTRLDIAPRFDETPEQAAERREAGRMAAKGDSARGRTNISLDTLREKTKTRRFDVETPKKINEINFFESPEIQRDRFDSLRDVSIVMLANILHSNPDFEKKLDISNFENVRELSRYATGIHPGPAENAAIHKILELREHPNSEVSRYFADEWSSIAATAREIERDMSALEKADLRSRHAPEEKGVVSKTVLFVKKHPLISLGIALAGAYGVYKLISGIRERFSPAPSGEKKDGEAKERTGFMGWLVGIGASILAIFGLGRFLGRDGVKKFFKEKLGWDINASRAAQVLTLMSQGKFKDAWEVAWEGADENSEFHGKMAKVISDDTRTEISGKTLFELREETFEDFISRRAQIQDEAGLKASEYGGDWVGFIGFDSRKKNQEQIAVRGFLKKHEATIRQIMPVRDETTLEEILQKLYTHLTGKSSGAAVAAAGGAAAATAPGETSERDRAIERLPGAKKARAIENEKVLSQKINFAYINQMNKAVSDREQVLKDLLTKSLKPEEREDVEEKLATLLAQKDQLGELISKHNSAYLAYRDALERDADEETLILRFTELIEAKELLEEHFDDIFAREDWKVLEALAITHALRFGIFVWRRFGKANDIRVENANYLFSKYANRLSIERIRESLRELRKRKPGRAKIHTMAALKRRNNRLFREMENFMSTVGKSYSDEKLKRGITRDHFAEMDRLEGEIVKQQSHLDTLWRQKNEALKAAIAKGDKRGQSALLKEIQEIGNERVRLEFGSTKHIGGIFDRWSMAFRGIGGTEKEREKGIAAFRGFFKRAIGKQRKTEKLAQAASASRVWIRRGKLVFLGASVALGGEILADEKTGRGKAYAQAGLSALPLVGTYMDFHSAFSGNEAMTGRKLDVSDRFISGAFGVAGLATDALTVFGIGIIGRGVLIGLKAGRGMSRAARVAKVVEAAKAAKTAEKAKAAAGAYRGVRVLEQAGKWGFRVSLGTALGVPAYMAFTEQAELDVSDEFMKEVIQPAGIAAAPETPPESGSREAA